MKNIIVLLSIASASLTSAHAENRLFPTDILHAGEMDSSIAIGHMKYGYNYSAPTLSYTASGSSTSESARLQYGFGSDWQAGVALNYASQAVVRNKGTFNGAPYQSEYKFDGRRNPSIFVARSFVGDDSAPFSLTAKLQVDPNTTGQASNYAGAIYAGWKSSDTLRLFGGFWANTNRAANSPSSNNIDFGAFKAIAESITLVPSVTYGRTRAINTTSAYTSASIDMSAIFALARNTYLMPSIGYFRQSSIDVGGGGHLGPTNGRSAAISLYHLFQ